MMILLLVLLIKEGTALIQTGVFAGGCFWCMEAQLQRVKGVTCVQPGYTGGHVDNPTYQQVKSGTTGHYEVVKVTFDPQLLSYFQLLDIFFTIHDPTQDNGQGQDIGTQYRSAIFYMDKRQEQLGRKKLSQFSSQGKQVYTALFPLEKFYKAEDYHQNYWNTKGKENPYCSIIPDKLMKLRNHFKDYYVGEETL